MTVRQFARPWMAALSAAALVFSVSAPGVARADYSAVSPPTTQGLANAVLAAARQAEASAQSQGLSPSASTTTIEAAILGVIARSGADSMIVMQALRLAETLSGDPLITHAIGAAGGRMSDAGRGCQGCTIPFATGAGQTAGGGGTPAYSHRGPI